jgi:hypothetical protein
MENRPLHSMYIYLTHSDSDELESIQTLISPVAAGPPPELASVYSGPPLNKRSNNLLARLLASD